MRGYVGMGWVGVCVCVRGGVGGWGGVGWGGAVCVCVGWGMGVCGVGACAVVG